MVLLLIVMVSVIKSDLVIVSVPKYGAPGVALFAENEIEQALVECYQHPFGGVDIGQFEISKNDVLLLVDSFRHSKIDDAPDLTMAEICTIRIVNSHKQSQRLSVYWGNAKQPTVCFSINGVRCICLKETRKDDGGPLDHALMVDGKIRALAKKR